MLRITVAALLLTLHTYALKINVDDMDKALSFYEKTLDFEVLDRSDYPRSVTLSGDDEVKIVLHAVKRLTDSGLRFTLQVNDLDEAIVRMKTRGVEFVETQPRTEGVGKAISIRDPFGRSISLMHQTIRKVEPFREPRLYNFGYRVADMDAARAFYCGVLGFVPLTERYLPRDLPLGHADKSFAFMLHQRDGVPAIASDGEPFNVIVFATDDLAKTRARLEGSGVKVQPSTGGLRFTDPFGNVAEIVQR